MHLGVVRVRVLADGHLRDDKYDGLLVEELQVFASNTPEQLLQEIEDRLLKDPQHIKIAGLFGADGNRIAGNIEALPSGLSPNVPTNAVVVRLDSGVREVQNVRVAARSLPNGESLVIGRKIDEITEIAKSSCAHLRWACCRHLSWRLSSEWY